MSEIKFFIQSSYETIKISHLIVVTPTSLNVSSNYKPTRKNHQKQGINTVPDNISIKLRSQSMLLIFHYLGSKEPPSYVSIFLISSLPFETGSYREVHLFAFKRMTYGQTARPFFSFLSPCRIVSNYDDDMIGYLWFIVFCSLVNVVWI